MRFWKKRHESSISKRSWHSPTANCRRHSKRLLRCRRSRHRRIRILPLKRRCSTASRYCTLTTSSSCRKCASYVVGDDLGDVGFDFEDLRIRKEMMGVKTESSQMDTKASNGDFDFRFRIVSCFPQTCLKLLGLLVCGPMTNIGPCNQTVRFYTKRETPCYRCLPLFI